MKIFARLPLKVRLPLVLAFLVAAIVVGILGHPSRTLLLASALLFILGGWRISKTRSFVLVLILVPALVGLMLTHFDWQHPFLTRYSAGLFSVIAALLIVDGIRIEEWVEIFRGEPGGLPLSGLRPLAIGTAVGTISMASNIQEQRTCRKLANIHSWRAKSRTSIFLDSVALPFYNAVESHEFIDEALRRWSPRDGGSTRATSSHAKAPVELTLGNSSFIARLSDLNDFPLFANVRTAVLTAAQIPDAWKAAIARLEKPARVLNVGDDTGQFRTYLLESGFSVRDMPERLGTSKSVDGSGQGEANWNVMQRPMEEAASGHCDHVLLHHNAFLEAVNRSGLAAALSRLDELSRPGGHIYFDYPVTVLPLSQGSILKAHVDGIGEVEYGYSRHQKHDEVHDCWVEYTVRQEHESSCVRAPLRFLAPELEVVLATARAAGFSCSTSPMSGCFSFLGGELVLVELNHLTGF